jgi:hypothetical protein
MDNQVQIIDNVVTIDTILNSVKTKKSLDTTDLKDLLNKITKLLDSNNNLSKSEISKLISIITKGKKNSYLVKRYKYVEPIMNKITDKYAISTNDINNIFEISTGMLRPTL